MPSSEDILAVLPPKADQRVDYGSDPNQFIELRFPDKQGPHPLVITIHGGYWMADCSLEYTGHLCDALRLKGAATANIEFRRVGDAGGGWPGSFEDVCNAFDYLYQNAAKQNINPDKIVVIGHSAGGQLALCLAAHDKRVKDVISLCGVVDVQKAFDLCLGPDAVVNYLGGTPADVADHYSQANPMELTIQDARQWIFHGGKDDRVPFDFSSEYVKAKKAKNEKVELFEDKDAGHFEVIDPNSKFFKEIEKVVFQRCFV